MKKRILIKIGTKVLTRENQRLNYNRITDLIDQIIQLKKDYQVILVSSGAAGAGKEFFQFDDEKDPLIKKQMLASVGQGRLFQVYSDFFREQSVFTAQALISRSDFHSETAFENIKITLEGLLRHGIIPIINENDVTSFQESSFGDNDQLAALTATMMHVDLLVIISDIQGFFTANPKKDPQAKLIEKVESISEELLALCEDSMSSDGTGGMYSKLKAAEFAAKNGISTIVASGKEENCLLKAARGEKIGTLFPGALKKNRRSKENWMIAGANIKGTLTIDEGAQKALDNNKSLLAVGVLSVSGSFHQKDVVLIQNQDQIRVGVGLTNFHSHEIDQMIKDDKKPHGIIVIHKNHLYTLK
ncbi:MAG: glutamate 5-kinase [Deltaproteobacteria bacterium]|nr:glutamate 5-kinase [Deltaproteobacteria bacterium]